MHHDHHRKEEMASSSSLFEPEATPAGNSGRYPSDILNSVVERGEAQISPARAMGDETLITSLRIIEAGGCDSAELKTVGILGKATGTGVRARSLIESEHHLNDATINAVPIRPKKVYADADSTLKLRKTKTRAGYQWPGLATSEKLKTLGFADAEYIQHRSGRRDPAHCRDMRHLQDEGAGEDQEQSSTSRTWMPRSERPKAWAAMKL